MTNHNEYLTEKEEIFITKLLRSLSGRQNDLFDEEGVYMPIDFNDVTSFMLELSRKGVINIDPILPGVSRIRLIRDSIILQTLNVSAKLCGNYLFDESDKSNPYFIDYD